MKISENKYITLSYDLNVGEGDNLELMERATAEQPMEFIFGTNTMLDSFEKQIEGLEQGAEFSFQLKPEDAYGEYNEAHIVEISKKLFEINGKIDDNVLYEGNVIPMMDSSGNRLMGSVVVINDNVVTMDFNHPLAGENMYFTGKVLGVRDASPEEIAKLFTRDCSYCDCDCGSCCCESEDFDKENEACSCNSFNGGGCGSGCCENC